MVKKETKVAGPRAMSDYRLTVTVIPYAQGTPDPHWWAAPVVVTMNLVELAPVGVAPYAPLLASTPKEGPHPHIVNGVIALADALCSQIDDVIAEKGPNLRDAQRWALISAVGLWFRTVDKAPHSIPGEVHYLQFSSKRGKAPVLDFLSPGAPYEPTQNALNNMQQEYTGRVNESCAKIRKDAQAKEDFYRRYGVSPEEETE